MSEPAGAAFLPNSVIRLLRLEGVAVLVAALVAYQLMGGNWWLFALLLLAPDLAMLGALAGPQWAARIYNYAHSYVVPAGLTAIAALGGWHWLLPYLLIWVAHIAMDRALGYGLKYPGVFHDTHLGPIGKAKRQAANADAR